MNETLTQSELAQSRETKLNGTKEEREQAQASQIIRIGNEIIKRAKKSGVEYPEVNRTYKSGGKVDELEYGRFGNALSHTTDESSTVIKGNENAPKRGLDLYKHLNLKNDDHGTRHGESIEINAFGSSHPQSPEESPLQGRLNVTPESSEQGVRLSADETVHAAAGILNNLRGEVAAREIQLNKPEEEANRADVDRILKS